MRWSKLRRKTRLNNFHNGYIIGHPATDYSTGVFNIRADIDSLFLRKIITCTSLIIDSYK